MQVELLKPHTHAGLVCAPGTRLSLEADQAQWLLNQGVARSAPTSAPAPETFPTPTPTPTTNPNPKTNPRTEEKLK